MSLHPFETRLAALWPPDEWRDLTVLAAVSGGADSVALLRAVAALKTGGAGRLCVAHFNHKLRDEAEDDERFVVALCKQLGLSCETGFGHVAQLAADASEGIEPAARRARYEFLKETAGRLGARFVLTAHTADDQAETILHRIVRGTGIAGLAGMSRTRRLGHATLLRPLLSVRRRELEEYLRDIGQPFREDSSNADRRFTRNRIRHELLPLLGRQYNSAVADALLRLGSLAADVQGVIDELVDQLHQRAVKFENKSAVEIDTAQLAGQPPHLLRELLALVWRRQSWPMRSMGFVQWDQLARMLLISDADCSSSTAVNKQIFPGNVQAEIRNGILRLMRSE
ncbi:MAG: tRNA lysidine(34) synthetase TilS [Thermoguttaceae bacterium]|jgi:tRNA(Ile)-lysidine synthase